MPATRSIENVIKATLLVVVGNAVGCTDGEAGRKEWSSRISVQGDNCMFFVSAYASLSQCNDDTISNTGLAGRMPYVCSQ